MKVFEYTNPSKIVDFQNTELANGCVFHVLVGRSSNGKVQAILYPNESMSDTTYSFIVKPSKLFIVRNKYTVPQYIEKFLKDGDCYPTWLWSYSNGFFMDSSRRG